MAVRGSLRVLGFVIYVASIFVMPIAILFGTTGIYLGILFTGLFLFFLRYRGGEKIARLLEVSTFPSASQKGSSLENATAELARRLQIPCPKLVVLSHPALNIAALGFSKKDSRVIITQGLLDGLKREELLAVISRELVCIAAGETRTRSWLSRFSSIFEMLAHAGSRRRANKNYLSFRSFVRQLVFYPLAIIPFRILRPRLTAFELDSLALRTFRDPQAFSEALRKLDASKERIPLCVPLSTQHLFLVSPHTQSSIAGLLFTEKELSPRIRQIENLRTFG